MRAQANSADGTGETALEAQARALAETQLDVHRAASAESAPFALPLFETTLEEVYRHLITKGVGDIKLQRPAEWFLDNYYIVRRVARQVAKDLPPGFIRRLPVLTTGPHADQPRVNALASELIARKGIELNRHTLDCFVATYQNTAPLSIAELWALPTLLHASVLSGLLGFLAELQAPLESRGAPAGVERSIRELRLLAELDWQLFFEQHSCVEAVLREDPAKIYSNMDFNTCDDYRKAVEELAWNTGVPEEEVAKQAIVLAGSAAADPRLGHVGYYLIAEGRAQLEAQLNFRPRGLERVRRLIKRFATLAYLVPLATLTAAPLLLVGWYAVFGSHELWSTASRIALALACLLAVMPLWSLALMAMQRLLAKLLPPRRLPKLDYSKGVPDNARSLVVIPTQFAHADDVTGMLQQLELHYLANPDPMLGFALLTDYLDATEIQEDGELLESAAAGIDALNNKHGNGKTGPFLLLHREPRWNPAEGRYMGWERKRGKLEELNRLLRGDKETTFVRKLGAAERLEDIRFVITLDSDTELPLGAAQRLIGLLAHPLNQAVFDASTGRVVAGYTVVQPRLEISPASVYTTRFSRIFAGNAGFDIYSHASSELYQDLFGSGIYCGKGIYDVEAFSRSLEGRVPENRLASHDLLEGIHGRTALASDIVLYEQYPSLYATFSRRMHRWVRGDWQLLPWLLPRVPSSGTDRLNNRLSPIDRWKIVDNLRRSIVGPCLCVLLVAGWTVLPVSPVLVTLLALAILLAPLLSAVTNPRERREALARCGLAIVFVLHEATVVIDAITRVIIRTTITHKNLLQWTSAAHSELAFSKQSLRAALWREMRYSPVLAVAIAALVGWQRPTALFCAGPILALWVLAPEIARWISLPCSPRSTPLNTADKRRLRLLARRTWLFFETFVGPADQWLPIDNYQATPREQTAHRTSPTNIGMMLLSTLSAYDFGYIGQSELSLRVRRSFDSIARLARYRGHLLNWYETKNLEPLLPRYVSTVDSGNLAGSLLALKEGLREAAQGPVFPAQAWLGLGDALALIDDSLATLEQRVDASTASAASTAAANSLRTVLARMHADTQGRQTDSMVTAYAKLVSLCDTTSAELSGALLALLQTGVYRHEVDDLHSLRTAKDCLERQLQQMRREIDRVVPWLSLMEEPAARALVLPTQLQLHEVPDVANCLQTKLAAWASEQRRLGLLTEELQLSVTRLREALASGSDNARQLREELLSLAHRADREAYAMDFRLLFDSERKLFHIGYNVTTDQTDPHYYDLLASEARLASYFAIIKRDVPKSHWYALGRPMTAVGASSALLSWGGTMFEYLMPSLLMRSRQGTLLQHSVEAAVDAQIAYGARKGVPWGISESAYSRLDSHQTYQYRSFGVPGLGLKRDLEDDLVVAPYASVLAVSVQPKAVVDNIVRLTALDMYGVYGLFEAVDFHADTALSENTGPRAVVRSYMAHHQGMLLVALDNALHQQIMVDRFHAEPAVSAGEILLNEHRPLNARAELPATPNAEAESSEQAARAQELSTPWSPDAQGRPQAFVFGNGHLSTVLTDRGGGGLRWEGIALTRYQPDSTSDGDGIWLYIHDKESGNSWRATSEQGRTTFAAHNAEFHQRDHGISVHVAVSIAPADDVELRRVTLHNESSRPRRLSATSACEPVLLDLADAATHPAFTRLFLESEYIAELDALVFTRRPRGEGEGRAVLVQRLVHESVAVTFGGYQTDRGDFLGRCRNIRQPGWLEERPGQHAGRLGTVIDPVMALRADVMLAPNQSVTFAFVTTVARSRSAAVALAAQYSSLQSVRWSFQDAQTQSPARLARAGLSPALLPAIQRLFSALLFLDPTFRATGEATSEAAASRPCKNAFWGQGISGDLPIVLLRAGDPDATIVREIVLAQRYLRSCGVGFDLVILDDEPSGYAADGLGTLRKALTRTKLGSWLNRPGGAHLLALDQFDDQALGRIAATARVVLDTREGSLANQMSRRTQRPPALPRYEPPMVREADDPVLPEPAALLFDNGTGGFSEDGREYRISVRPGQPTPAPWCNVLANPDFGCLVSESSLGSTWSENAGENRLTPWRNDPVADSPSEVLYLRDEETAAVWSSTPLPAGGEVETRVHHGAGYTSFLRESHGLKQELTIFVPPNTSLKVVRLRLKNRQPRHRRLTATYYVEWVLGSLREQQSPYIESAVDAANSCLLATCDWNAEFAGRFAFLACERGLHGFTTDRTDFLGPAGDLSQPDALTRWGLSGSVATGGDPCGALQMHLELDQAGDTQDEIVTHFILGQAPTRAEALTEVNRFRQASVVDNAWNELGAFWDDLLGGVRVKTPEPAMDLLLNRWLLYQTLSSRIFGRTAFYQSSGAFGFRDQLQDVLALLQVAPDRARAQIVEAAAHQFEEGDVLHWWHPPSGRGVRTRCSDDLAWLAYVTVSYVEATGDVSILDEEIPFLEGEPLADKEQDRYAEFSRSQEVKPLLEHCRRALLRALTSGSHGLPLMGEGDWNDGMNRVGEQGRGESVWLGWFLCATMNGFADLCATGGSVLDEADQWRSRAESLRAAIEASAWDGNWYARAFHDDGSVVGSGSEQECKIDSIAQSWAVLSEVGDAKRSKRALLAAEEHLVNEQDRLVLLLRPPFDVTAHDPGYIRAYPPGVRENGGQYTHAACWLGLAHAKRGDGQAAARIFQLINPILRSQNPADSKRYRIEPYVLSGDVYSSGPWVGRGGWSWYTGAAAWTYRLGVEAILGLHMTAGQLRIDPCIPTQWTGFEAWVRLPGGELHIVVENPDAVSQGIANILLDDKPLQSNCIDSTLIDFASASAQGLHRLRVRLGKSGPLKAD